MALNDDEEDAKVPGSTEEDYAPSEPSPEVGNISAAVNPSPKIDTAGLAAQPAALDRPAIEKPERLSPPVEPDYSSNPDDEDATARQYVAYNRQLETYNRNLEKQRAREAFAAQRKAVNKSASADNQVTGRQYELDEQGVAIPRIDPVTGQQAVKERKHPVQYDAQGRPYQVVYNEGGEAPRAVTNPDGTTSASLSKKIKDPDADAEYGANPDDPNDPNLYRKTKLTPWQTVDPKEGIISSDNRLAIASAKHLHQREMHSLSSQHTDLSLKIQQLRRDLPESDQDATQSTPSTGDADFSTPAATISAGGLSAAARAKQENNKQAYSAAAPPPKAITSWGSVNKEATAKAQAEWAAGEELRKKSLADTERLLATDDEIKGARSQMLDLLIKHKALKDEGPAGFLKRQREEYRNSLANLPADKAPEAIQEASKQIGQANVDIQSSNADLTQRISDLTAKRQRGGTAADIAEWDKEAAGIQADGQQLEQKIAQRNTQAEQLKTGAEVFNKNQQAKTREQRDQMRKDPVIAPMADQLDQLDQEATDRREKLQSIADPTERQKAKDLIETDLQSKRDAIASGIQVAQQEDFDKKQKSDSDLSDKARQRAELEKGISDAEASDNLAAGDTAPMSESPTIAKNKELLAKMDAEPNAAAIKERQAQLKEDDQKLTFSDGSGYTVLHNGNVAINPASMRPEGLRPKGMPSWEDQIKKAQEDGKLNEEQAAAMTKRMALQAQDVQERIVDKTVNNNAFKDWVFTHDQALWDKVKDSDFSPTDPQETSNLRSAALSFLKEKPAFINEVADVASKFIFELAPSTVGSIATAAGVLANAGGYADNAVGNWLQDVGMGVEALKEQSMDPRLADFTAGNIAGHAGGLAGFLIPGAVVGKVAKAAGMSAEVAAFLSQAATGAVGAAQNAASVYNEARQMGKSEKEAFLPFLLSGVVGAGVVIPVSHYLNTFAEPVKNALLKGLVKTATEAVAFTALNDATSLANNTIAQRFYDENRDLFAGIAESSESGAISGAILGMISAAVGGAKVSRLKQKYNIPKDWTGNIEDLAQADAQIASLHTQPTAKDLVKRRSELISQLQAANGDAAPVLEQQVAMVNAAIKADPLNVPSESRADLASALVKVSQGVKFQDLSETERATLGKAKTSSGVTFIEDHNGNTIITDTAKEWLSGAAPHASDLIGLTGKAAKDATKGTFDEVSAQGGQEESLQQDSILGGATEGTPKPDSKAPEKPPTSTTPLPKVDPEPLSDDAPMAKRKSRAGEMWSGAQEGDTFTSSDSFGENYTITIKKTRDGSRYGEILTPRGDLVDNIQIDKDPESHTKGNGLLFGQEMVRAEKSEPIAENNEENSGTTDNLIPEVPSPEGKTGDDYSSTISNNRKTVESSLNSLADGKYVLHTAEGDQVPVTVQTGEKSGKKTILAADAPEMDLVAELMWGSSRDADGNETWSKGRLTKEEGEESESPEGNSAAVEMGDIPEMPQVRPLTDLETKQAKALSVRLQKEAGASPGAADAFSRQHIRDGGKPADIIQSFNDAGGIAKQDAISDSIQTAEAMGGQDAQKFIEQADLENTKIEGKPLTPNQKQKLTKAIQQLAPEITRWNEAFGEISFPGKDERSEVSGGAELNGMDHLKINLDDILNRKVGNYDVLLNDPERAKLLISEEAIHAIGNKILSERSMLSARSKESIIGSVGSFRGSKVSDTPTEKDHADAEAADLFRSLPKELQNHVRGIYSENAMANEDFELGHEFLRMLAQHDIAVDRGGRIIADGKVLTEQTLGQKLIDQIREHLAKLFSYFSKLSERMREGGAKEEDISNVEQIRAQIRESIKTLRTRVDESQLASYQEAYARKTSATRYARDARGKGQARQNGGTLVRGTNDIGSDLGETLGSEGRSGLPGSGDRVSGGGNAPTELSESGLPEQEGDWNAVVPKSNINVRLRRPGPVELSEIQSSAGTELQPRNRQRASNKEQEAQMAHKWKPSLAKAGDFTDRGPIIFARMNGKMVNLSGHGRQNAQSLMYEQDGVSAKKNRAWIKQEMKRNGYSAEEIAKVDSMKDPVWAAELADLGDYNENGAGLLGLVRDSNVEGMSKGELAASDANLMARIRDGRLLTSLHVSENGNILDLPQNRDALQAIYRSFSAPRELKSSDGKFNKEFEARVRGSLLAYALGPEHTDLITRLVEDTGGVKNLADGIMYAAPELAKTKAEGGVDIGQDILKPAVETLLAFKADAEKFGNSLQTFLDQNDFLRTNNPAAEKLLLELASRNRSAKKIGEFLAEMAAKESKRALEEGQYDSALFSRSNASNNEAARLRKLQEKQRSEGLNRYETDELTDLEKRSGQHFMGFFDEARKTPDFSLDSQEEAKPTPKTSPADQLSLLSRRAEKSESKEAAKAIQSRLAKTDDQGFYSKMEDVLASKIQGKAATAEQVRALISKPDSGIKPDEVKWSGISDIIDTLASENDGKVPKDALMEYIRGAGKVQFKEVSTQANDLTKQFADQGYELEYDAQDESYTYRNRSTGEYDDFEELPEELQDAVTDQTSGGNQPIPTKYSKWTLPGGENYREVVLTMPGSSDLSLKKGMEPRQMEDGTWNIWDKDGWVYREGAGTKEELLGKASQDEMLATPTQPVYRSSHFAETPNYVAHMRLNERTDSTGEDGLFIEEIQSDRHQAGREKGYREDKEGELQSLLEQRDSLPDGSEKDAVQSRINELGSGDVGIADAPFRKDWPVQMFKRALRDAVASGKGWIGWTDGETQANRYKLSTKVDALRYAKKSDGTYQIKYIGKGRNEEWKTLGASIPESELADNVGKEVAQKIVDGEGEKDNFSGAMDLRGTNLEVGGEGMKGFYDQILPKEIGKYVKKWGAKVEQGGIPKEKFFIEGDASTAFAAYREDNSAISVGDNSDDVRAEAIKRIGTTPIWKISITPEMRQSVSDGQSLFSRRAPKSAGQPDLFDDQLDLFIHARKETETYEKALETEGITDPHAKQEAAMQDLGLTAPEALKLFPSEEASAPTANYKRISRKLVDEATAPAAAPAAKPGSITDFGEKIGGARKDTSIKTGPTGVTKSTDERPAWARRYDIAQIAKSMDASEEGKWQISDNKQKDWRGQPKDIGRPFNSKEEAEAAIPLLAVSRNHDVRMERVNPLTPEEKAANEAARKAAANQLSDIATKVEALKEEHGALLQKAMMSDMYQKAFDKGDIAQDVYDKIKENGGILTPEEQAKAQEVQGQIDQIKNSLGSGLPTKEDAEHKYTIWRKVSDQKRVQVVEKEFPTREDALRYMAEHAQEIIETKTSHREELFATPENAVRTGAARREGPADAQLFQDAFGFRGVEFGNWMRQEGEKGNERQEVLDHAYDGLHDLAETLGIPAKAISLNGDLALAFGARGQGLQGAKAHYERTYAAINLTKMSGAGSLAHEWFHAFDHYMARLDGKAKGEMVRNEDGNLVFPATSREGDYSSHGFGYKSQVRPEVREAYEGLMKTIKYRAVQFQEDSAKAEQFVKSTRDSLGNEIKSLRDSLSRQLDATYYKRNNKPATEAQLAKFDELTLPMINGENLETEWRSIDSKGSRYGYTTRWTNDNLEALNSLYKEVRGRAGFQKEGGGALNNLSAYMRRYRERIAMLESAEKQETKTRTVPSNYAMDAKKIDQGAVTDYWTTPHELAARAFAAYVEDRIADTGNKSEFLSYGADNRLPEYRLWNLRPFPEGEERTAINGAFENLFQTLKAEQTEKGVSLRSRRAPLDEDSLKNYLTKSNLERSRVEEATYEISKQLEEIDRLAEKGQDYGDLFSWKGADDSQNRPDPNEGLPRQEGAGEKPVDATPSILKVGLPGGAKEAFKESGNKISSLVHSVLSREIPGFNIDGAYVRSPEDFASALMPLRSPYMESLKVAFLDKDDRVIHSQVLFVGTVNESVASPRDILISFQKAKEKSPGIVSALIAHNHPSGDPAPSNADNKVTPMIRRALEAVGIKRFDHVITNGKTGYSYERKGTFEIPDSEQAPWEVVERDALYKLDSNTAPAYIANLRQGAGQTTAHILYLNTRGMVSAVERVPNGTSDEMAVANAISMGVGRESPYGVVIDLGGKPRSEVLEVIKKVRQVCQDTNISLMDIGTKDLKSMYAAGILETPEAYGASGAVTQESPEQLQLDFDKAREDGLKSPAQRLRESQELISRTAAQFKGMPNYSFDEARQKARLAIANAAKSFDPSKGIPFEAYAGVAAKNALRDLYRVESRYADRFQTTLDESIRNDFQGNEVTRKDQITDGNTPLASDQAAMNESQLLLNNSISELPERMQMAVRGMLDGQNGQEIADAMGVSRQAVNNLQKAAMRRLEGNLRSQGITDIGSLLSRSAPKEDADGDDIDQIMRSLNEELDHDVIGGLRDRAISEEGSGKPKQIGRPDLAYGARNPETRAVDQYYTDTAPKETRAQWEDAAQGMIRKDPERTHSDIQRKGLSGGSLTPEETVAAGIIADKLRRKMVAEPTDENKKAFNVFQYAYRATGSVAARALASRNDPFMTPAQRHRDFLIDMMMKPSKKAEKDIKAASNDPTKQAALIDEEARRVLEKLKSEGITPEDIMGERVTMQLADKKMISELRSLLSRAASGVSEIKRSAFDMLIKNKSLDAISKATGLKTAEIQKIKDDCIAKLRKDHFAKFQAGAKADKATLMTGKKVSESAAEAEFQKWINGLGFVSNEKQGKPKFNVEDPAHVMRVAKAIQEARGDVGFLDKAYELWIAGILSGPQTHVANITGNLGSAALNLTLQRGMEAFVNLAIGDSKSASFGEFKWLMKGLMPGVSKGYAMGARAWSSEHDFFEHTALGTPLEMDRYDKTGGSQAAIGGKTGKTVRIPMRSLLFSDSMFKTTIGQMEAGAMAYRIAKAEGLKGQALSDRIETLSKTRGEVVAENLSKVAVTKDSVRWFAERLAGRDETIDPEELIEDRGSEAWQMAREQAAYDAAKASGWTEEAWQRAVESSREMTFQQDLKRGSDGANMFEDMASKLQDARDSNKMLGVFFPFVRTPYNIFRIGIRKSPMGAFNLAAQAAKGLYSMKNGKVYLEGHPEVVRDLAEQAIAWGAGALLFGAAQGDDDDDDKQLLITGSHPRSKESAGIRGLNERAFSGEYVIRIGGRNGVTIPYGRIEPIATVLGTTIDIIKGIKRNGTTPDNMNALWGYMLDQANGKTFLNGASTISDLARGKTDPIEAVKKGVLQAIVPNIIRSPLRSLDEYVRDSRHASPVYTMLPASGLAEEQINPYGEPIKKSGNPITRLFLSTPIASDETLRASDKLLLNWNRANPTEAWAPQSPQAIFKDAKGKDVQMTAEETKRFKVAAGRLASAKLRGVVNPRSASNPTLEDLKRVKNAFESASHEARQRIFNPIYIAKRNTN